MTRRTVLRIVLMVLGIDSVGLMGRGRSARAADIDFPRVQAVPEPVSETGTLSSAEMEDLVAFAEVLVEGRTLTSIERGYLVEHIDNRTRRTAGYLTLYQTTVRTLQRLAGQRMTGLALGERIELATRHRLGASEVWPAEELGPFPDEMRILRTRAVPDLIGGYYGSPGGWAVVGYATFPGRCGNLTRYVRPES